MVTHLVLAGSTVEARAWARQQGLARRQWLYASSPHAIDGLTNFVTVMLPGFTSHPRAGRILAVVRRCEAKQGGLRAVART